MSPREALVRRVLDAVTHGRIDEVADDLDPEVEFLSGLAGSIGHIFRGPAGLHAWWADITEAFVEPRWQLLEHHEAGPVSVLHLSFQARARISGIDFEGEMAQLWEFRDGRVARTSSFKEPAEAFRAAGLAP